MKSFKEFLNEKSVDEAFLNRGTTAADDNAKSFNRAEDKNKIIKELDKALNGYLTNQSSEIETKSPVHLSWSDVKLKKEAQDVTVDIDIWYDHNGKMEDETKNIKTSVKLPFIADEITRGTIMTASYDEFKVKSINVKRGWNNIKVKIKAVIIGLEI